MRSRHPRAWVWLCLTIMACGGSAPKSAVLEPPEAPEPPTNPLAWLPGDASVVGRVLLAPFRDTPLWSLWDRLHREEQPFLRFIDVALVEEITVGGRLQNEQGEQASFVAVIKGRFGEGYLEQLARRDQISGVTRGPLTLYERPDVAWTQVSPEILVVCSRDREGTVVAHGGAGAKVPIRESVLYRSLAERVSLGSADLALILEDDSGAGREALLRENRQYGQLAEDVVRAGVSLDMGQNVLLAAVAEASDAAQAAELERSVDETLAELSNNPFVGVLGFTPVVSALKANADGNYVVVRGSVPEADVRVLLDRLSTIVEIAFSQGKIALPVP